MTDEFEASLRAALQPAPPSAEFLTRVMLRVEAQRRQTRRRRQTFAMACVAVVVAITVVALYRQQVEHRNAEAKAQLLFALRMAGHELRQAQLSCFSEREAAPKGDVP